MTDRFLFYCLAPIVWLHVALCDARIWRARCAYWRLWWTLRGAARCFVAAACLVAACTLGAYAWALYTLGRWLTS